MVINGESRFFLWLIMIIYGYSWLIMVDKSAKHHGSAVIVPQLTRRGLFASRLASTPQNCKYSSAPDSMGSMVLAMVKKHHRTMAKAISCSYLNHH